ncbi:MAG: hypothetical protein P1U32_03865 [Legionellaceae bacterium]|nr:hypothetical protein [Legionellaceae bacterium]
MHKPAHWMVGVLLMFFSFQLNAESCSHTIDCKEWEPDNCACGVRAKCHGVTAQNPTGMCRCFGAEGACHESSSGSVRIRGANPVRRRPLVGDDVGEMRVQTVD